MTNRGRFGRHNDDSLGMNRGRRIAPARGNYVAAKTELQYVYRCAACNTERRVSFGERSAPVRLSKWLPPGWTLLRCESLVQDEPKDLGPPLPGPMAFWLCGVCTTTPEESKAIAVLRHPIRLVP